MDPFIIFHLLVLILSIVIHEVSHGYAALALGDATAKYQGRLTLNPLKHIDPVGSVAIPAILILTHSSFLFGWAKPVPYNPYNLRNQRWGEAFVAAAGPLVNLTIALCFGLLIKFGGGALSSSFVDLAAQIVYINLLLGIFNLMPIPPMDGSKILRAALPFRLALSFQRLEDRLFMFGPVAGFILVFLVVSFLWPIFSPLVGALFTLLVG